MKYTTKNGEFQLGIGTYLLLKIYKPMSWQTFRCSSHSILRSRFNRAPQNMHTHVEFVPKIRKATTTRVLITSSTIQRRDKFPIITCLVISVDELKCSRI
jgi:hypothetical protein